MPPAGEIAGAASAGLMLIVATEGGLLVYPVSTAIACRVSVELTVMAPLYAFDDVVGVVPSVV